MIEHLAAAIVSAIVALLLSPVALFAMRRAPIHLRYRGIASHCSNCGTNIASVQRWPLLARFRNAGTCSLCSTPIDRDSPWFDVVLAIVLAITGGIVGFAWILPALLFFMTALLAITVVDLRHYMIPTKMVYPALWICMLLMVIPSINQPGHYLTALIGMAGSWLFFCVIYIIYPPGLGFGDVRLSALTGFMTGWISLSNAFLGVFLGLLSGGVLGLLLVIVRIRGRKEPIPYGPFLALGATIAILGPTAASNF